MSKRLITEKEERAYRLRHYDFEGKSAEETATVMGISVAEVNRLLRSLKRKAPQLFPILTLLQAKAYHLYEVEGWSVGEISKSTKQSKDAIWKMLQRLVSKGMYFTKGKGRILSYHPEMDAHVKKRF